MKAGFHRAVRALGSPVIHVASRPLILHRERAELPGGWLLAANHESPFDAALLIATTPRVIHWLSIVELFQHPLSRWFLSSMGALPLDRRRPDPTTVRSVVRLLRAGKVVGIFPEGGLQRGELKEGVARLAEIARVPVVPCAIAGSARFSRWTSWLPLRRTRWAVAYGEPIAPGAGMNGALQQSLHSLREEVRAHV
jgi:1-acyl-sn-glycerol-3-phosphate acyltransferase